MNWKIVAIIFILLFVAETFFMIWSVMYSNSEEEKTLICYYDVCEEYPDAWYENNLCTCYDYDVLGDLIPVDWEIIK